MFIKIDKQGSLMELSGLLAMKKVFADKSKVLDKDAITFIFKCSDTISGMRIYTHEYPSKESMEQWYSIISKHLGGKYD